MGRAGRKAGKMILGARKEDTSPELIFHVLKLLGSFWIMAI
jgi:hypothetical protein